MQKHHRAKVDFKTVEAARDDKEFKGMSIKAIAKKYNAPIDTVRDWVYYRTRGRA